MILSEQDAKTKRCQESFGDQNVTPSGYIISVAHPNASGAANIALYSSPSMCIGSACMAWHWYNRTLGESNAGLGRGYCGKAGKP